MTMNFPHIHMTGFRQPSPYSPAFALAVSGLIQCVEAYTGKPQTEAWAVFNRAMEKNGGRYVQ